VGRVTRGTRIGGTLKRTLATLFIAVTWFLAGIKFVMDWIGRATGRPTVDFMTLIDIFDGAQHRRAYH
jgi:hypothetical protein